MSLESSPVQTGAPCESSAKTMVWQQPLSYPYKPYVCMACATIFASRLKFEILNDAFNRARDPYGIGLSPVGPSYELPSVQRTFPAGFTQGPLACPLPEPETMFQPIAC